MNDSLQTFISVFDHCLYNLDQQMGKHAAKASVPAVRKLELYRPERRQPGDKIAR